jgi:phosphohistidine phosphatase SixA
MFVRCALKPMSVGPGSMMCVTKVGHQPSMGGKQGRLLIKYVNVSTGFKVAAILVKCCLQNVSV